MLESTQIKMHSYGISCKRFYLNVQLFEKSAEDFRLRHRTMEVNCGAQSIEKLPFSSHLPFRKLCPCYLGKSPELRVNSFH